jgi:putative membrane protein
MQADPRGDRLRPHPWKGVLAGALGGLVASIAMSKFYLLLPRAGSDSQTDEEDSTVKVASAISQAIFHHELTSDQKTMAASAVHYAFGITMATLYGLLAEFRESTRLGWGLPFGAAIWLGAHVITVPTLGLSEPVTCAAPAAEGYELTAHLVYGAVVEGIRRSLRAHPLRQAYRCER